MRIIANDFFKLAAVQNSCSELKKRLRLFKKIIFRAYAKRNRRLLKIKKTFFLKNFRFFYFKKLKPFRYSLFILSFMLFQNLFSSKNYNFYYFYLNNELIFLMPSDLMYIY